MPTTNVSQGNASTTRAPTTSAPTLSSAGNNSAALTEAPTAAPTPATSTAHNNSVAAPAAPAVDASASGSWSAEQPTNASKGKAASSASTSRHLFPLEAWGQMALLVEMEELYLVRAIIITGVTVLLLVAGCCYMRHKRAQKRIDPLRNLAKRGASKKIQPAQGGRGASDAPLAFDGSSAFDEPDSSAAGLTPALDAGLGDLPDTTENPVAGGLRISSE